MIDKRLHLDNGHVVEQNTGDLVSNHSVVLNAARNKAQQTSDQQWIINAQTPPFFKRSNSNNDYRIAKNAIVAVVGENGAGKSSFFRQLCGLGKGQRQLADNQGKLSRRALRRRCFYVDQDVNRQLLCDSVLEEVMLNMPSSDKSRAISILNELDLAHLIQAHPLSISGGQKQRLALATAVAANREFTVLDEPTSGLDNNNVLRVIEQITHLKKRGSTVVIISHDPQFLLACCDLVVHIQKRSIEEMYQLDDAGKQRLRRFMQLGD
ncbi:ATP-binding cassette domain-containing protein [Vibrio sonorensis]|uniref:ATP-binding cassette domain-containing protein n=1 Tax=Vibrio sonorensis TaxID=1004316 RepID=UPI0008DA5B6B|nr:ATP-binding cassette domain-containing protein [Vibrio sonorensis]